VEQFPCRASDSDRSALARLFYLSGRRAVYFAHKSIVHACDASEWVSMHSVCIKRHWLPLAPLQTLFPLPRQPSTPSPRRPLRCYLARRPCCTRRRTRIPARGDDRSRSRRKTRVQISSKHRGRFPLIIASPRAFDLVAKPIDPSLDDSPRPWRAPGG